MRSFFLALAFACIVAAPAKAQGRVIVIATLNGEKSTLAEEDAKDAIATLGGLDKILAKKGVKSLTFTVRVNDEEAIYGVPAASVKIRWVATEPSGDALDSGSEGVVAAETTQARARKRALLVVIKNLDSLHAFLAAP